MPLVRDGAAETSEVPSKPVDAASASIGEGVDNQNEGKKESGGASGACAKHAI